MREEGIKAIWMRPYTRTTIDPDFDTKLKNICNYSGLKNNSQNTR